MAVGCGSLTNNAVAGKQKRREKKAPAQFLYKQISIQSFKLKARFITTGRRQTHYINDGNDGI